MRNLPHIAGVILFCLCSHAANACHGPAMETQTFLKDIPEDALSEEMVGSVEIIDTQIVKPGRIRVFFGNWTGLPYEQFWTGALRERQPSSGPRHRVA